jgi:hypothetical protein
LGDAGLVVPVQPDSASAPQMMVVLPRFMGG